MEELIELGPLQAARPQRILFEVVPVYSHSHIHF